ncbi:MAG: hypothetical protein WC444_06295 [Candidatus Paceibacterota bacterium]
MDDNRPFPIQGGVFRQPDGEVRRPVERYLPCTIPWWLAEEAYKLYVKEGGRGQTLERLAERGGFGREELIYLIRGRWGE